MIHVRGGFEGLAAEAAEQLLDVHQGSFAFKAHGPPAKASPQSPTGQLRGLVPRLVG